MYCTRFLCASTLHPYIRCVVRVTHIIFYKKKEEKNTMKARLVYLCIYQATTAHTYTTDICITHAIYTLHPTWDIHYPTMTFM